MAKLLSFEEILDKSYDQCVKGRNDESLLRELGINEELLDDKCLFFAIKMLGFDPKEGPPNTRMTVIANKFSIVASMGFEWGWRARRLYDKGEK